MVLIGSQALNYYIPLNRKLHDYDFIATKKELEQWNKKYSKYLVKSTDYSYVYDIDGEIVEIRNPEFLDETDKELLDISVGFRWEYSKFGLVNIPTIQLLYDIKKSTTLCINEHKHKYDLELIEKKFNLTSETGFFKKRLAETQNRVSKSTKVLKDFFHKYDGIPEYVKHDRLHDLYADALGLSMPTYKRITVAETDISEDLFNKLSYDQKISLMAEESLVLALERWLIPQLIENGINYKIIDHFYNNNESMPTYLILKHCCITGLRGEAEFITKFSRENFFAIESLWCQYKSKFKFPNWFLNEIFELRKKYRNGEKVGIV